MDAQEYGRLIGTFLPGIYLILVGFGARLGPSKMIGRRIYVVIGVVLLLIGLGQRIAAEPMTVPEKAADLRISLLEYFGGLPLQANELLRFDDVSVEETTVIVHSTFTHPDQDQLMEASAPFQEGAIRVFCSDGDVRDMLQHGVSLEMRIQTIVKDQTVSAFVDAASCQ